MLELVSVGVRVWVREVRCHLEVYGKGVMGVLEGISVGGVRVWVL